MTGTAAELTPIREIDDHVDRRRRARPDHDAAAERLRRRAHGRDPRYTAWNDVVSVEPEGDGLMHSLSFGGRITGAAGTR